MEGSLGTRRGCRIWIRSRFQKGNVSRWLPLTLRVTIKSSTLLTKPMSEEIPRKSFWIPVHATVGRYFVNGGDVGGWGVIVADNLGYWQWLGSSGRDSLRILSLSGATRS